MDRLDQMTLFARVVEAGSFAAAAERLGRTRAAVSKQIARLEERLGVQLLQRTTRRMRPTEVGHEFYRHCARIAEQVEAAERDVASWHAEPRGSLRIAAPVTFGRRYLAPLIRPFTQQYPLVVVDVVLDDGTPDLIEQNFDVGIRITAAPDSSYVATRLADSAMTVCASPSYFAEHPPPRSPSDLDLHNCLVYSELENPRVWRFLDDQNIRVSGNFAVNHGESLLRATLDGLGIAYMPTFIAGPYLADGSLQPALEDCTRSSQRIFALHPPNRNLAPKVRAFVDFLVDAFSPRAPWEESRVG